MISMPIVQHRLYLVTRDGGSNGVRRLGVVGLPGCMLIDLAIVNHPSRAAIMFRCDDHPAAPSDWLIHWYFLYYSKPLISVQAGFDIGNPVVWDGTRRGDCNWSGMWVNI